MPSSEVMHKYKHHQLHSGSAKGPVVKSRSQAIAIMLSEKRKEGQHGGKYPHKASGGPLDIRPKVKNPPPWVVNPNSGGAYNAPEIPTDVDKFMKFQLPPNGMLEGQPKIMPQVEGLYAFGGGLGVLPGTNVPPLPGGVGSMMPPQGLGQQFPGKFGLNPIQPGMRADGGNVVPFGPRLIDANWERFRLNPNYQQNRETNALLHRVLGMDDNVVPMSSGPDDKARGGGLGYQFGGSPTSMGLTPGWIERQEARNISHTGPIISAVGGRTDNHAINVPSGSYVLPAAHVSAMGQGNTLNGMQILTRMFGQPMKLPHGAGPPRMGAPRPFHMPGMSSSGGSRGDGHLGRPVPIMAAGGEFVLSPDQVAKVGGGDVNHGHAVLDRWVQNTHKKYAKTIANLPPPAKT